jgi:hypothetical protein
MSHSPLPMDMERAMVPGPMTAMMLPFVKGGGWGRSALPKSAIFPGSTLNSAIFFLLCAMIDFLSLLQGKKLHFIASLSFSSD